MAILSLAKVGAKLEHPSSGRFAATFSHKGRREVACLPVLMELETENAVH
ncbi:hypothetical protein [Mesorhizobium sp. ORS 3428]|nr:hypothetical protein [Mesorhizobium sp. ORS 3428]